jgi:hypothetical protein
MKKIITIFLLIVSAITSAQKPVTLVFDKGMTVVNGFVNDGVQITLPSKKYDFYMLGEKNILGIENFDNIEQFKGVEKQFRDMYQAKLSGDTEIVVEIQDSPMFGYCTVIYSYYEYGFHTNGITNMWISIGDGDYTIVITTYDGIYYKRFIRIKDGCLIEQRELPIYKEE